MGSAHSIRATHFQRPQNNKQTGVEPDDDGDEHHIAITNKMVERLVEDATIAGGAAAAAAQATPRGDYKDKIFMEKLQCMDDRHSERCGITVEDINAMATRIDIRTSNMVSVDPVCAECTEKVIKCYNDNKSMSDTFKCWDTVGEFTKCVSEAAALRLRERTVREARELARRTRHVAHAREHALRDLATLNDD
ncbi:uncharacterized protein LOC142972763 [Anticarsia gemmatalis]|uniref:uncharacterized protein LOC142972763 n=1 Tax=Anticarsia gemmatalis TaxID=129554 RepID=UPI003F75DA8E